jgi:threonine/homoserine/homoserine lactone efflux protein
MLALRGIHEDPESALAALERVRDTPMPERVSERRSLRTWYRSGVLLLVFGGFMAMPPEKSGWRDWVRTAIAVVVGTVIWIITWVLPLTFMLAMAWACESHARHLGTATMTYYGGEEATVEAAVAAGERKHDPHRKRRTLVRAGLLVLTVVLPLGFVAYTIAVDHALGFSPFGALGALVALSLVIATAVVSSRG